MLSDADLTALGAGGFVAALARDEDDHVARGALADWLDDRGLHEDAERHRQWPAAKAWLAAFAAEHRNGYDGEGEITYRDVLDAGTAYVDHGDYCTQWGGESLRDAMYDGQAAAYWRAWSVVTGRPVPDDGGFGSAPFSCSC